MNKIKLLCHPIQPILEDHCKTWCKFKNTLISPYSNNAYIMAQNNIVKDNDDDNKQNNIQLFSLLGG